MEDIVKHCENFFNILEIEDWATRVEKVNEIEAAFKLANFISTIFTRLDGDSRLKEFVENNEKLRDKKSALKHPFESLLLSLADTEDEELIDLALEKYVKVRGNSDSILNCPLYNVELLETLLEVFAKSELNVCNEVLDSFERLTIDDDYFNDYVNFVLNDGDKINVTSLLVQCLNTKKEEIKMKILNHILEKSRDSEDNKGFWNNFVNCDHKILVKVFQDHSWFFEEFFEFLLHSVQYFKCSFDGGQREWSGHSWLSFDELVKLVQSLWKVDDDVGSYVKQIVSGIEGQPIWKDVLEKLTPDVENVQQLPLKVDVMYSRSDPDSCYLTLKK
ncbi:hypothetical protein B566_EDAN016048 [Ephemera danica]|nr:hypothetical protein B566_EDAN016048 [Ephemera danica]